MSAWSKSTKPVVTGISASDIFMVDEAEVAVTPGIAQPGWVYKKSHGGSRYTYETLVAMADPATDAEYEAAGGADDDTDFPDTVITISAQPADSSDVAGESISFSVTASASPTATLAYAWEESIDGGTTFVPTADAGIYSGSATDTLTISDNTTVDTFQYRCVVSAASTGASETSDAATVTVTP